MFPRLRVIISQHVQTPNHYVHLKLIAYVNYTSISKHLPMLIAKNHLSP